MASRFVQLCAVRPQGPADQLLALDDDGTVWVWISGDGWRIWADQRSHGVGKPPVDAVSTTTVQDAAVITHAQSAQLLVRPERR